MTVEQLKEQLGFAKNSRERLFDLCINLIATLKTDIDKPGTLPVAEKRKIVELSTEALKLNELGYQFKFKAEPVFSEETLKAMPNFKGHHGAWGKKGGNDGEQA